MSQVRRIVLDVELDDGRTFPGLRVRNPALVAYDLERVSKKWESPSEVPMFWRTFIAWRQLVNQGDYTGDFKTFRETDCVEIDQTEGHEEGEEVDPTTPADGSTPA